MFFSLKLQIKQAWRLWYCHLNPQPVFISGALVASYLPGDEDLAQANLGQAAAEAQKTLPRERRSNAERALKGWTTQQHPAAPSCEILASYSFLEDLNE